MSRILVAGEIITIDVSCVMSLTCVMSRILVAGEIITIDVSCVMSLTCVMSRILVAGEIIAIDPRGMGSGFRARLRARPCAFTACDKAVDDDGLEEFGTGTMTSIQVPLET